MDLFQNLPREIALQCLIRVPFSQLHSFGSVCKAWKDQIQLPELLRLRKSTGKAQPLLVISQAQVNPTGKDVNRLVVLEPETGCWSELPHLQEFPNGLPSFCEMVAVGSELVVMGGYDPETWFSDCLDSVFIFDFLSSTWRHGSVMPGGPRSLFCCATDGDRTVLNAGGHDHEKNALKSAWTYDVATDCWSQLPDMAKERDECKSLFHRGKFHNISGYPTDTQGLFHLNNVEIFDTSTRQWSESDDDVLSISKLTCVVGSDKKVYTCHDNDVVVLEDDTWQFFAKLHVDVADTPYLVAFRGHLLVFDASIWGVVPHGAYYKMELNERIWTKVEIPTMYYGYVESSCCLII